MLSNACIKSGISIWFLVNRANIENELCEQKDVPNNCCKGNCVLEKRLDETGGAQSTPTIPSIKKIPDFSLFTPSNSLKLEFAPQPKSVGPFSFLQTETAGISTSIFRPPCL